MHLCAFAFSKKNLRALCEKCHISLEILKGNCAFAKVREDFKKAKAQRFVLYKYLQSIYYSLNSVF